jgi:ClpP class serine protease
MKRQRYAPIGTLAINPKAFGLVFDLSDDETKEPELTLNGVAVVKIRGPLMHRKEFFFDSYEAIKERMIEAIAANPRAIVLSIDSPGGLVSGAFDTARELRIIAAAAGVKLLAHVEGQATSAAYAIASAAEWIGVSQTAMLGSVGVVDTLVDVTAQNQALGLNVQVVTSGARKADGNPNVPISKESLSASQGHVDSLAEMFFALVAEHGWSNVDALRAMEASIVHGQEAVRIGLASEIATLEKTIAMVGPEMVRDGGAATAKENGEMEKEKTAAVDALKKMAQSDDEKDAKMARDALKALGEAEGDEKEPEAEGDEEPEAETDDEEKDEEPEAETDDEEKDEEASASKLAKAGYGEEEKAASKSAVSIAATALAEVHKLRAESQKAKSDAERKRLIASRPDFSPEMVKVLRSAPMATVREFCKTLPKGPHRTDRTAAAAVATATVRGAEQGNGLASQLPPDEKAALDLRMGLTATALKVIHSPNRMAFGVTVPAATTERKAG